MHVDEHYKQILGYLSNEHLSNPCHAPSPGETLCGMPLRSLRSDGVLVEISDQVPFGGSGNLVRTKPGVPRFVGGHAARIAVVSSATSAAVPYADPRCYMLGATKAIKASIRVHGNARYDETLDVLVCIGPRAVAKQAALLALIDSVRIPA